MAEWTWEWALVVAGLFVFLPLAGALIAAGFCLMGFAFSGAWLMWLEVFYALERAGYWIVGKKFTPRPRKDGYGRQVMWPAKRKKYGKPRGLGR